MVTPKEVYRIPLKEAEYIALPSIIIGPWGKDYHTITERVYLPDLEIHSGSSKEDHGNDLSLSCNQL